MMRSLQPQVSHLVAYPFVRHAEHIVEIRDVYLDEFADTDDEVEDEEAEERELRREEKRKVRTNTPIRG